jgi:hypothetical protein
LAGSPHKKQVSIVPAIFYNASGFTVQDNLNSKARLVRVKPITLGLVYEDNIFGFFLYEINELSLKHLIEMRKKQEILRFFPFS